MQIIEKKTKNKGVVYQYKENFMDNGRRVVVSVTLDSKSKAAQKRASIMLWEKYQERGNKKKAAPNMTLEVACNQWAAAEQDKVKPPTHYQHLVYIKKLLSVLPDHILLKDFTPATAEKALNEIYYGEKKSHSFSMAVLSALRGTVKQAAANGFPIDPAPYVALKLKRRPATKQELEKRSAKFLNPEELKSVLNQLQAVNTRIALACEFMSLTGLRVGELLALRQQDINLQERTIQVTGTMTQHAVNGEKRGTPKKYIFVPFCFPQSAGG